MKAHIKPFICSFILIALISCGVQAAEKAKSKVVTIKTSAICQSCKNRIEKSLKNTVGVEEAQLNLNSKKVKVKYDPAKVSEEQIRTAISNTGYAADDVKPNEEVYNKLPGCCKQPGLCDHK